MVERVCAPWVELLHDRRAPHPPTTPTRHRWGNGPRVGRHGYSTRLGDPWTFNNRTLTFNTTVAFTDGSQTTYSRRERPQLFFSADGALTPLALVTGVQEVGSGASYTLIQPIGPGGS